MKGSFAGLAILVVAVSLLVFPGVERLAAYPGDDCSGLQGRAYRQCAETMRKIFEEINKRNAPPEPEKPKPPVFAEEPVAKRFYGNFLGDPFEVEYIINAAESVELDLSRVYAKDTQVLDTVIRDSNVTREKAVDGRVRVRIGFTMQSFAVLCSQNYAPLPVPEIFWRENDKAEWKLVEFAPAKVLISPMSLCDEYPDTREAPKTLLDVSRKVHAQALFLLAGIAAIFAWVLLGRAFLSERKRIERSPLVRARKLLVRTKKVLTSREASSLLREALRVKFSVFTGDSRREVAEKLSKMPFWKAYAEETGALWEETTAVLYEECDPPADLFMKIRTLIEKLERRERDE